MTSSSLPETVIANKTSIQSDLEQRRISLESLPYFYHIHLHMPCNQRCIMCVPNGRHSSTTLPYEQFVSLFEQIRPYAEHITLIGGEPLLYPRIEDVLNLLSHYPIVVSINTNATLLGDGVSKSLLDLHELHLKCSIDAATRRTYYRIRGTDWFDKTVDNIRRISVKASGRPNIKVILVYVVMKENLNEVLPFIELFKELDLERIEFHPVRHVGDWVVENRTGWTFRGEEQICESFSGEYNAVMEEARDLAGRYELEIEVQAVPEG